MSMDADWEEVAALDELTAQRRLVRKVRGIEVLLLMQGKDVVALRNLCTHLGKPLDRGRTMGGQITCPAHGACFDLRTGKPVAGPAVTAVHLFPTRISDCERVEIDISSLPAGDAIGWFRAEMHSRS